MDALEQLEGNDGRAHDTIRAIRESDGDGLQLAIDTCISAAEHEHHVPLQQLLLRAAGAATYCNTLQHTATHCNTLQHAATH